MSWEDMPSGLRSTLSDYFRQHRVTTFARVDVVLALLRINTAESLAYAQELTGRPITRCPSNIPPWPPKPVRRDPGVPRVSYVTKPNPCAPSSDMHSRYERIKIGMTEEQLLQLKFSRRDVRYLIRLGRLRMI